MKKMKWLCLMLCCLVLFTGCEQLQIAGEETATAPSLMLLDMPDYESQETVVASTGGADGTMVVDLWLDASQLMGGINEDPTSLYPQTARRYRQGGFHYRFGTSTVGWYEDVLQCLTEAAGDNRVRVLRVGNERLPDSYLEAYGFTGTQAEMRSYRRDLLTYAIDPMPSVFSEFSSEDMVDSFYSLGSPQMNQMARFAAGNGAELENPGQVEQMNLLLTAAVDAFHQKKQEPPRELNATGDSLESPLSYALNNLDTRRLSVITCDPATLRRVQGTTLDGSQVGYIEELLRQRELFDSGMSVGLYALQLDYMGHMVSFGAADFPESLIWGKPKYSDYEKKAVGVQPMPRVLLMLVIGQGDQVDSYTKALNQRLNENRRLKEMRGPEDGRLVYKANGETVVQQPFHFSYEYTVISRPGLGYYTQDTPGAELTAGGQQSQEKNGLKTLTLSAAKDEVLVYSWPAEDLPDGVQLDLSTLADARVEVTSSLTLTEILTNGPEVVLPEGSQVLTLRDKLYCFTQQENPFADNDAANPFRLGKIRWSQDGSRLEAEVKVDHTRLRSGYYRIKLVAEVTGEQLEWPLVSWAQNDTGLSVEISNGDIVAWQTLMDVVSRYGRERNTIPSQFTHAWGSAEETTYKGVDIPDFPQVYKAPGLSRLLGQLRDAANLETAPLIRCTFDVFVPEILQP